MAKANSTLTKESLAKFFEYDEKTGIFTRLHTIHGNSFRKQITIANSNGYIVFEVCGRKEYAHRMAWLWCSGIQPIYNIDHINGIKTDNRICNLRDVPQKINRHNIHKTNPNKISGICGVRPSLKRWSARIFASGKEIHLGNFPTKEAAYAVYILAKKKMHEGYVITHPSSSVPLSLPHSL